LGGTVLYTFRGNLLGYDSSTGALRWTAKVGAADTELTMAGNLAVLWPNSETTDTSSPDIAVDATTGHVVWSFDRKEFAAVAGSGAGLVFLATYFHRELYAVDARTGAVRWQAKTFVAQDSAGVTTGSDVLMVEGGESDPVGTQLVDRSLSDGHIRWQYAVSGLTVLPRPITVVGDEAVVQVMPPSAGEPAPLTALSIAAGRKLWSAEVPILVSRPPLIDASGALVAAEDGVYACAA
jgi:outer membrane protein assembly factor BamB